MKLCSKFQVKKVKNVAEKTKKGPRLVLPYQDKTKIGPFFDFLLHFSIFLLEILNIVLQLSCKGMLKILSKNIGKFMRKSKKGPILVLS